MPFFPRRARASNLSAAFGSVVCPPLGDRSDGLTKGRGRRFLENEAPGPRVEAGAHHLLVGEARQQDHPDARLAAQQLFADLDPRHAGEPDIDHRDVGSHAVRLTQGVLAAQGFRDHPEVRVVRDYGRETFEHYGVVIHHEDQAWTRSGVRTLRPREGALLRSSERLRTL